MAHLNVVATIVARKGREGEVRNLLLGLIGPSRQDPGCLSYDLHQGVDDPRVFLFYETWESRELLEEHLKTPHLLNWRDASKELVETLDVKFLEKIS